AGDADEHDPRFANWQWFKPVEAPPQAVTQYYAFEVPPEVFGKAQPDLHDLRLADAKGERIPYALRVLRTESKQHIVPARMFDAGPSKDGKSYEVSVELEKVDAPGYNEIQIDTTGTNYHRRVEVFGDSSDSFKEPRAILAGQGKEKHRYLVHFETEQ